MAFGGFPIGGIPIGGIQLTGAGVNYTLTAGYVRFIGATPAVTMLVPSPRLSWIGAEVLHPGVAKGRLSWTGAEVLHPGVAKGRLSWIGVEVLRSVANAASSAGGCFILW